MKVNKQGTAVGLRPGLEGNGAQLFLLRSISSSSLMLQGWSQARGVVRHERGKLWWCVSAKAVPPSSCAASPVVVWPALLLAGKGTQGYCGCPSSLLPLASWLEQCMLLGGSRRHQRLLGDRDTIWLCCKHKSAKRPGAPLEEELLYSIVVQMGEFKPSTSPFPAPLSIFLNKKKKK